MPIHTIRLRTPWRLRRRGNHDIWERAFGCPSNLSNEETVQLVLRNARAEVVVRLNGEELAPVDAGDGGTGFDVKGLLEGRNTLTLEISGGTPSDPRRREPPVDVCLEIESRPGQ